MKKVFTLVLAILVCAALVFPVLAAEGFVPSITYKGYPDIVRTQTPDGKKAVAVINKDGDFEEAIGAGWLVIVSVAQAKDSAKLNEEEKALLLGQYDELSAGTAQPFGDGKVIRELVFAKLACNHEHATTLAEEGVTITVTFRLGVKEADDLQVMTKTTADGEWVAAEEVTVNADGTATVVLEDLGVIAFAVNG